MKHQAIDEIDVKLQKEKRKGKTVRKVTKKSVKKVTKKKKTSKKRKK